MGREDKEMMEKHWKQLEAIKLRIETVGGTLLPTAWICVDDFSVELGADDPEAFQVSAHVPDSEALAAAMDHRA